MNVKRGVTLGGVLVAVVGCLDFGDRVVQRRLPDDEEDGLVTDQEPPPTQADAGTLTTDPHAILAVDPGHGPFTGGQLALLRGNGFSSEVNVWFGEQRVSDASLVVVDTRRIQVQVPPSSRGTVDVITQNGDDASTRRVLAEGYEYDPFYVTPGSGPTSGGSIVTLVGDDTGWSAKSKVSIDLAECEVLEVRKPEAAPEELDCRVPAGTPGQKVVQVENPDGEKQTVNGGFSYADSQNGFEGGLSGEALQDDLEVLVLNGFTGERVAGATVLLGSAKPRRETSDKTGRAAFSELASAGTETITVAMPCMQPVTLVDVPVNKATVYIDPVLTPACIPPDAEIPIFGGGGGSARVNTIHGELAFGFGVEYKRGGWLNVPQVPSANEAQVAYVFELAQNSREVFRLPSRADAVTPAAEGTLGYGFRYDTRSSGNITLYALAGIERTNPRQFTAYAFGLLKGVRAENPDERPYIPMNLTLDRVISLDISGPQPTERGPDRVMVDLALRVGRSGFVPLPRSRQSLLLPISEPVEFFGFPQLIGSLGGAQYVTSAMAVSGAGADLPWSKLEAIGTRSTDEPVTLKDFVEIPQLVKPGLNLAWDGHSLEVDWTGGGSRVDLLVFEIEDAGGAFRWRVIAPGDQQQIALPHLSMEPGLGLAPGRLNVTVSAARIKDFDYASLRERHFSSSGWTAFATDTIASFLP